MTSILTIITAIVGSSAVASLIQFFVSRYDKSADRLKDIEEKIDDLFESMGRNQADDSRRRILAANDEIVHFSTLHSEEWWNQLNDDITEYRRYCHDHPLYENGRAVHAINNIEKAYQDNLSINNFLH